MFVGFLCFRLEDRVIVVNVVLGGDCFCYVKFREIVIVLCVCSFVRII